MEYTKLMVSLEPKVPFSEIAISDLSDIGYDSFLETETGIEAYIPQEEFKESELGFLKGYESCQVDFSFEHLPYTNWNAKWEADFEPVIVGNRCIVRAPFHGEREGFEHEVIIQPKMSFGTGHHATTFLMISYLLDIEVKGRRTLDVGSGTGVLAILAEKLGAVNILATDIDDHVVENAKENLALNKTVEIHVKKADVTNDFYENYDLILANINLNVLLHNMQTISSAGNQGALVLMSGFYVDDVPVLEAAAAENGLILEEVRNQERWASVLFKKK
jgi:ribosomal protein L11 methyltransferase